LRADVVLSISIILAEGWQHYALWAEFHGIPEKELRRFSRVLSDWGFAWGRLIDANTQDIKKALTDKHVHDDVSGGDEIVNGNK
jgi:hypothetical protein